MSKYGCFMFVDFRKPFDINQACDQSYSDIYHIVNQLATREKQNIISYFNDLSFKISNITLINGKEDDA